MMTFLELQKRIVQTRKARQGVKNRTDYFDDWQEEEFCKELYKRALRAANEVVQHYDASGSLDRSEKISVMFGERKDTTTKEMSAYNELHKLYSEQAAELSQLQQKNFELNKELKQAKEKLTRAKIGGRRKDYKKEAAIQLYKHEHPDASIRTIAKAVGCSTTTVQNALKIVKSDAGGTLSVDIPRDKGKLERLIAGLVDAIARDTSDKDRQIHQQTLMLCRSALDEIAE